MINEVQKIVNSLKIPHTEIEVIEKYFVSKRIKKGELLLSSGDHQNEIGIINSGLIRYYYLDPYGNENTKFFASSNDIVMSFQAFILNIPIDFYIEALEDTNLFIIKKSNLKKLLNERIFWRDLYYKELEKAYCLKEKRSHDLLMKNALERYKTFIIDFKDLKNRIKQQYIASYLGIKPETLSRIKKLI